jgi:hypothetical protein
MIVPSGGSDVNEFSHTPNSVAELMRPGLVGTNKSSLLDTLFDLWLSVNIFSWIKKQSPGKHRTKRP